MNDKFKGLSLLSLIKYIGYIPQLASTILAMVAFVEGIMQGASGPEKKEAVLTSMENTWESVAANFETQKTFSDLSPLIGLMIDLCVTIYNLFWKPKAPTQ
jgi:hypothetical protein